MVLARVFWASENYFQTSTFWSQLAQRASWKIEFLCTLLIQNNVIFYNGKIAVLKWVKVNTQGGTHSIHDGEDRQSLILEAQKKYMILKFYPSPPQKKKKEPGGIKISYPKKYKS